MGCGERSTQDGSWGEVHAGRVMGRGPCGTDLGKGILGPWVGMSLWPNRPLTL